MKYYKIIDVKTGLSIGFTISREEAEYVLAERIIMTDYNKYEILEDYDVEDKDFNC